MARRRKPSSTDPLADLDRKIEIPEREMAAQRAALEKLRQMAKPRHQELRAPATHVPTLKTA